MKKLALQVAALSVALAGTASAADLRRPLPVKAPAPVVVAAYNWTGCYVGAGGGYGMWNQREQYIDNGVLFGIPNDNSGRGWFGTVQVGCDYQVGSNIVIGAFGDYDFSGIKGTMSNPSLFTVGEEKLKNSWAAGGRIGWIPYQASRLLVYVSGGYTQAKFDAIDAVLAAGGASPFDLPAHTYSGWFVGTGYEYGLGFLPGLFWKTEYRYADYGKDRLLIAAAGGDELEFHKRIHTVRSELVWRFNFGGPVVARY